MWGKFTRVANQATNPVAFFKQAGYEQFANIAGHTGDKDEFLFQNTSKKFKVYIVAC